MVGFCILIHPSLPSAPRISAPPTVRNSQASPQQWQKIRRSVHARSANKRARLHGRYDVQCQQSSQLSELRAWFEAMAPASNHARSSLRARKELVCILSVSKVTSKTKVLPSLRNVFALAMGPSLWSLHLVKSGTRLQAMRGFDSTMGSARCLRRRHPVSSHIHAAARASGWYLAQQIAQRASRGTAQG
jgi:hypothetical protein